MTKQRFHSIPHRRVTGLLLACGLWAFPLGACDTDTVRSAALTAERDVHLLAVIAEGEDAASDEVQAQLDAWLEAEADRLNVVLDRVDASDPAVSWQDYGIPSAPPELPVVVLTGRFPMSRRAFIIDHWEGGPSEEDLAAILDSPARTAIRKNVLDQWAVVLYSPGTGDDHGKTEAVLAAVEAKWSDEQPPGVAVVRFDRADPKERLLCAFVGIHASEADWVGVVFGRGKLVAPPLVVDEISEENLNQLLTNLMAPCTCLQEAMPLGLDIPMKWEEELDTRVASLSTGGGYLEMTIGGEGDAPAPEAVPEPLAAAVAALEAEIPDEPKQVLATTLVPLAGVALLVFALTGWGIWRSKRRAN